MKYLPELFITTIITIITKVHIINPYLNIIKKYWTTQNYTELQIDNMYDIYSAAAYLVVAMFVYFIIEILKFIFNKLP